VLVGVEDVDVVGVNEEVDDGDDDALAVRAVDEQDGVFGFGFGIGFGVGMTVGI